MERAVTVYTTWPSIVEAEAAGRSIVEQRLPARPFGPGYSQETGGWGGQAPSSIGRPRMR